MNERNTPDPSDRARFGPRLVGLLALNGALLTALGAVTFGPSAEAQVRPRGSYTMAAARVQGAPSSAVFIVDTVSEELIAITYEPSQKEIVGIGYRNMAADAESLTRAGRPR